MGVENQRVKFLDIGHGDSFVIYLNNEQLGEENAIIIDIVHRKGRPEFFRQHFAKKEEQLFTYGGCFFRAKISILQKTKTGGIIMDLKEFTVGQKVGILAVRQRDKKERTGVITRIGRKYIYAKLDNSPYELQFDGFSDHPFLIFNDGTYSGDYHLYPSEKAMMEDEERKQLSFKLAKYISERNLSLDQLRKIQRIAFLEEPAVSDSEDELELNEEQLARNDEIFYAAQELCKVLTEKEELEWNMFFIGQIADYAAELLAENGEKVRFYSVVSDSEGNEHIEEYMSK